MRIFSVLAAAGLCGSLLLPALGQGQEIRLVEENGVVFRETTRMAKRPVTRTEMKSHTRTVFQDRYVNEKQTAQRPVLYPVTEVQYEPRWHNVLNPFSRPYIAYHPRVLTYWKSRTESYQVPVVRRETVQQQQTVQVPTRTLYFEDQQVVDRVAIGPSRNTTATMAPAGTLPVAPNSIGGVGVYGDEEPRVGTAPIVVGSPVRR